MTGSYGPLIWAFAITFSFAACLSGLWTWFRSPALTQNLIRRKGLGLIELRDYFHLRPGDWFWSFLFALIITFTLSISFYLLLSRDEYQGLPFWVMLTTSMFSSQTVFSEYRPMPYGILAAVLLGITLGRLLGLSMGKKLGAKRVLVTSRLRDPVKF